jgi:hypothetical protein
MLEDEKKKSVPGDDHNRRSVAIILALPEHEIFRPKH